MLLLRSTGRLATQQRLARARLKRMEVAGLLLNSRGVEQSGSSSGS